MNVTIGENNKFNVGGSATNFQECSPAIQQQAAPLHDFSTNQTESQRFPETGREHIKHVQ